MTKYKWYDPYAGFEPAYSLPDPWIKNISEFLNINMSILLHFKAYVKIHTDQFYLIIKVVCLEITDVPQVKKLPSLIGPTPLKAYKHPEKPV